MLALLALIFWITITGANYPSELLSNGLFWVQDRLVDFFCSINAPEWLYGALVFGVYRVLAWVVSVMLPPMAIFFPMFTLLEDAGYLPRVAYNLDKPFKRCCACGKQALTMCIESINLYYKNVKYIHIKNHHQLSCIGWLMVILFSWRS
jgi:ferrous iron transport protein B